MLKHVESAIFISSIKILYSKRNNFRSKDSALDALVDFTQTKTQLKKSFLDVKKAFDIIEHSISS